MHLLAFFFPIFGFGFVFLFPAGDHRLRQEQA